MKIYYYALIGTNKETGTISVAPCTVMGKNTNEATGLAYNSRFNIMPEDKWNNVDMTPLSEVSGEWILKAAQSL